ASLVPDQVVSVGISSTRPRRALFPAFESLNIFCRSGSKITGRVTDVETEPSFLVIRVLWPASSFRKCLPRTPPEKSYSSLICSVFLFIYFAFRRACPSRTYYSNTFTAFGIDYYQKQITIGHSDIDKTIFVFRMIRIGRGDRI